MLAIIPARKGSKRIPRKNIVDFNGEPLISRSIRAALSSEVISDLIVTTDCNEIAEIAVRFGAKVPFLRPDEYSGDNASIGEAVVYTAETLSKFENIKIDNVLILQATCPFVLGEDIDQAISMFLKGDVDAVASVSQHSTPIEAVFEIDTNNLLRNCILKDYADEILVTQQQRYRKRFVINGAIVVAKIEKLKEDPNYFYRSKSVGGYQMPPHRAIDIDTYLDLEFSKFLDRTINSTTGQTEI